MTLHSDSPNSGETMKFIATGRIVSRLMALVMVGAIMASVGCLLGEDAARRFWHIYLVAFAFCLSLSLGAIFFLIVQHLSRAGWSASVRRPAEYLAANVGFVALLFVPIAWSVWSENSELYPWSNEAAMVEADTHTAHGSSQLESGAHDEEPQETIATRSSLLRPEQKIMLQPKFFVGRWLVYFAIWISMAGIFWRNSIAQDRDRDFTRTQRVERLAAPFAVLFGLSVTGAAFDLLMSLTPTWQSTMFGVYFFAGSVVGSLAAVILMLLWLRRNHKLPVNVSNEHFLDFGRLLFGFVFFWGYIGFSQYMLLWYANIPVELTWFHDRGASTAPGESNFWGGVLLVLLFGHLLIPFAGLMSRHIKKNPRYLACWAVWLLAMHFLDLAWIVLPQLGPQPRIGLIELGTPLAFLAAYMAAIVALAVGRSTIPAGDPRLVESLGHESAY